MKNKKIRALMWASINMDDALSGCEIFETIEGINDHKRHCLLTGIITSYMRTFLENQGMTCLNEELKIENNPRFEKAHKTISDSRQYIYGHKDNLRETSVFSEEKTRTREEINKLEIEILKNGQASWKAQRSSLPDSYIPEIKELIKFQKRRISEKINEELSNIIIKRKLSFGTHTL